MKIREWTKYNLHLLLLMPGAILFVLFLAIPFLWIIRISFYQNIPGGYMSVAWVMENYKRFLGDFWYIQNALFFSLKIALSTVFSAVILAYPLAYCIARTSGRKKQLLLTIVLSPLLISMVCLILGLMIVLRREGLFNQILLWLGIISVPGKYIYDIKGVIIGLIYIVIPYIVLCLLDNLGRIDLCLEEAAMNLGATRWQTFFKITFPLSTPGMFAGSVIVLSMNFCAFAIPLMIGPDRLPMMGLIIYNQATAMNNMPFAAALATITVVVNIGILYIYIKLMNKFFFKRLGV